MKKTAFILLTLLVLLILTSCTKNYYEINGTDKDSITERIEGEIEYVVNVSSRSYHLSSCYIAKSIKEENKVITKDIDFITEREYTPCKKCIDK